MSALHWLIEQPIAHRGYHDMNKSVFENTLSAFRRAIDAGFAIECDLQYAADGVPVVFHDDNVKRLCPVDADIRSKLSSELAQMTIGGTKDRIPTFDQMLKLVDGQVPLVIELKGRRGDDDGFTGAVLDRLASYEGPVALMSFNTWLLDELKDMEATMPVGLTAEGTSESDFEAHRRIMARGLDFVSYNYEHLPNPFIEELRAAKTPVITWTVRGEAGRKATALYADQMTFEGFDPREVVA